ncbi:MAG: hypothetical protein COA94_07745 [Rickettsiales bacterium]|nr:MAG: hypothetical protein COA94_07745 [Rickettsiales bacterium]
MKLLELSVETEHIQMKCMDLEFTARCITLLMHSTSRDHKLSSLKTSLAIRMSDAELFTLMLDI